MKIDSLEYRGPNRELDLLRGLAIIAVITIHTAANFSRVDAINNLVISNIYLDVFSHFAVPLFIFISGFALSLKYSHVLSISLFYRKRFLSIMPGYIFFSFIYLLWSVAYNNKIPSMLSTIYNLLTGGYAYLWFVVLISQLYILYPYLIKICNEKNMPYLLTISLIVQIFWTTYLTSYTIVPLEIIRLVFFSHIFYFLFGIYASSHSIRYNIKSFRSLFILLIIATLATIISYSWINGVQKYGNFLNIPRDYFAVTNIPSTFIGTILFTLLVILLYNIASLAKDNTSVIIKIIYLLGKYSFGIFLIHAIYIDICIIFLKKLNIDPYNYLFYILLFIGTIILSISTVYLYFINSLPFGRRIFRPDIRK